MNYSEAIDEYLKYLKAKPKQFSYISRKIIGLCEREKIWDEAIVKIQKAIEDNPENADLHKLIGDIYLRAGKPDLGLAQYLLYENKSNSNGIALFNYAQRCEDEGDYNTAIKAYDEIITRDYWHYKDRAILRKASALVAVFRYQEALDAYNILISQKKKSQYTSDAYLGIGDIYLFKLRDINNALKTYEDLLKTFPKGKHANLARFRIADLYFMQEQPEKAKEEYEKIGKTAKEAEVKEEALFRLANLELLQENLDEAGKILTNMIKKYPEGKYVNDALRWSIFIGQHQQESEFTTYIRGLKHAKQMKYETAISDFEGLLQHTPQSNLADDAYFQLAELYIKLANYDKAIETYENLIKKYPESDLLPQAQMAIGDLYCLNLLDYNSAKIAYESVILNYPESIQADLVRKKVQKLSGKVAN